MNTSKSERAKESDNFEINCLLEKIKHTHDLDHALAINACDELKEIIWAKYDDLAEANDSEKDKASGVRVDARVNGTPAWKDTDEALPRPLEQILFVVDGKVKFGTRTIDEFVDASGWSFDIEQVEYWMELPEPPNDKT